MTPPLIVRRQSQPWDRLTREAYREHSRAFCRSIDRPADQMNDVVDAWDGCFGISFFETRQAMKEIAEAALANVRGAVSVEESSFSPAAERPLVFVDDDDWFAPDLADHLGQVAGFDGLLWTHVAVGFENRVQRFVPGTTDWWCYTNNYAVSPEFARLHGIAHVTQHWIADRTFRTLRLRRLEAPLSVANKHPASVVFLERTLSGPPSASELRRVVSGFVRGLEAIEDTELQGLEWARPHLEASGRHFSRVLASVR